MSQISALKVSWATDLSPTASYGDAGRCGAVCLGDAGVGRCTRGGVYREGGWEGYTGTQPVRVPDTHI